jgi:hypothetical protein
VVVRDVVEISVTMDGKVDLSVFLCFMDVFRRSDGQQGHRNAEHASQSSGHFHDVILPDGTDGHKPGRPHGGSGTQPGFAQPAHVQWA